VNIDPKNTAFGRHETFPLRYGWLTKGYKAIIEHPDIFAQPDRAMVKLGVGRNMVSAILYWLQAARLIKYADGQATPSAAQRRAVLASSAATFSSPESGKRSDTRRCSVSIVAMTFSALSVR